MSLSAVYPHRIRLRGPWECEPLDGPPPRRVTMPSRWRDAGLSDFHGLARFTRNFGYPGNIDATEHVWLTCAGSSGCREVRLNGQLLTREPGEIFAFDVTAILRERNRLDVLVDGATDDAGLWGEVALEIRKDAYLNDVSVVPTEAGATLMGTAVGVAPQPLELYVLVDGRHVEYRTIAPTTDGTPFRIDLADAYPGQVVRAELIHISSIWYIVELPIPHWKSG